MTEQFKKVIPFWVKWTHLGLAIFGVTAYLTAELAEYSNGFGYYLHAYLGLTLLLFIISRTIYGVVGKPQYRFSNWFPYNRAYFETIKEDIKHLIKLKIPERTDHKGLSGLVQAFGLLVFSWMAITGTIMFYAGNPEDSMIAELHEVGESLVPLFLFIHIGAVILHILFGENNLTKMLPFLSKQKEINT